jgi:Neocarzinostatin family
VSGASDDISVAESPAMASLEPSRSTVVATLALPTTVAQPTTAAQPTTGTVVVSPNDGLEDGQSVTVTWSGFPASKGIVATQCNTLTVTAVGQCNITTFKLGTSDASGAGSLRFTVHTGATGNGTCDATANNCTIYVSDQPDQTTVGYAPIRFGAGQASTTPTQAGDSTSATAPGSTTPTSGGSRSQTRSGSQSQTESGLANTGAGSTLALVIAGTTLIALGNVFRRASRRLTAVR